MTQDIHTTIVAALNRKGLSADSLNQYAEYLDAISEALVERERQITDTLLDVAERHSSFSRDEVQYEVQRSIPTLEFRPDAPEPERTNAEAFEAYLKDAEREKPSFAPQVRVVGVEDIMAAINGGTVPFEGVLNTGSVPKAWDADESKADKRARKAQEKADMEDRVTRLEEAVNTLAALARQHLNASI